MDRNYAQYLLKKTKDDYNLIAEEFSRSRQSIWEELKLLSQYTIPGEKILDLGCGNGRLLEIFKEMNIEYFGVDNSEKLLEIAKKKYPKKNFLIADALNLPFPNNYFDKIYSIAVLHHIPSTEFRLQFLKEAKRVLKPDGLLILAVWQIPLWRYIFSRQAILKLIRKSELDYRDIFISWGKKIDRYYHCFSEGELIDLMKRVNFKIKERGILKNKEGKRNNIYLIVEK